MHCLFIPFLATIVPVRKAVRNYQFLQLELSEENKTRRLGEMRCPFQSVNPHWEMETLSLCGFQLQAMGSWSYPPSLPLPGTFCLGI